MRTITLIVTGMVELVVPIMLVVGITGVQIVNALTLAEDLTLLAKTFGRQRNVRRKRTRENAARKRLLTIVKRPAKNVKTRHFWWSYEFLCMQIHDNVLAKQLLLVLVYLR